MMSKSELIQKIADDLSLSKKDVKAVIESLATHGYKELKKSGIFLLPGFAKFVVIKKPATKAGHLGRNSARFIGAVNTPVFRASTMLFPSAAAYDRYERGQYELISYGLHGLPTVTDLQDAVAQVQQWAHAAPQTDPQQQRYQHQQAGLPLFLGGEVEGGSRTIRRTLVISVAAVAGILLFAAIGLNQFAQSQIALLETPGYKIGRAHV